MSILGQTHRFYIGLDLGQKQDYTAMCIIDRMHTVYSDRDPVTYNFITKERLALRHAERTPLGTGYPDIVFRASTVVQHLAGLGPVTLTVDATGVGAPVVDLLKRARLSCTISPIVITGGHSVNRTPAHTTVPRRDLLANLQIMFEKGHIETARAIPLRDQLEDEISGLRSNGTRAAHDDLAFALALALWPVRRTT